MRCTHQDVCLWAAGVEVRSSVQHLEVLPSSQRFWETPVDVAIRENLFAMKTLAAVAAVKSHVVVMTESSPGAAVRSHGEGIVRSHVVVTTERSPGAVMTAKNRDEGIVRSHVVVTTENSPGAVMTAKNHDEGILRSPVAVVSVRNPVVEVTVRNPVVVVTLETPCKVHGLEYGQLGEVFQLLLSCRSGTVRQHTGPCLWA